MIQQLVCVGGLADGQEVSWCGEPHRVVIMPDPMAPARTTPEYGATTMTRQDGYDICEIFIHHREPIRFLKHRLLQDGEALTVLLDFYKKAHDCG